MPDYKGMYLTIMRAAEKALRLNQEAIQYIIDAQQKAEDLYVEAEDAPLRIIPPPQKNDE